MEKEKKSIPSIETKFYLHDQKKNVSIKSPDTTQMQMVEINARTKIYIAMDASPDEARSRYGEYLKGKKKF